MANPAYLQGLWQAHWFNLLWEGKHHSTLNSPGKGDLRVDLSQWFLLTLPPEVLLLALLPVLRGDDPLASTTGAAEVSTTKDNPGVSFG